MMGKPRSRILSILSGTLRSNYKKSAKENADVEYFRALERRYVRNYNKKSNNEGGRVPRKWKGIKRCTTTCWNRRIFESIERMDEREG